MPKRNLLICFDAFGTLFTPRKPVAQQYMEVGKSFGLAGFTEEDIAKSFKSAFKQESKQNPNYGKATGLGAEKWWSNIIHNTFKPYYGSSQQPPADLIATLIHRFHSKEGYALYPDVLPLLNKLRPGGGWTTDGRHVIIGVITNSDNRTADILTSLGLKVHSLHYGQPYHQGGMRPRYDIDFTVLSYDVSHEKPDQRIFAAAEEVLSTLIHSTDEVKKTPAEFHPEQWSKIYVGDEYAKDVVGATDAGWNAVLINRESGERQPDVEYLDDKQPTSLWDVFEKTKAVGFSSLEILSRWIPPRS